MGTTSNPRAAGDGVNWARHADTAPLGAVPAPPNLLLGLFSTPNNGNAGPEVLSVFEHLKLGVPAAVCDNPAPTDPERWNPKVVHDLVNGTVVVRWTGWCALHWASTLHSDPSLTLWTPVAAADPDVISLTAHEAILRVHPDVVKFFKLAP